MQRDPSDIGRASCRNSMDTCLRSQLITFRTSSTCVAGARRSRSSARRSCPARRDEGSFDKVGGSTSVRVGDDFSGSHDGSWFRHDKSRSRVIPPVAGRRGVHSSTTRGNACGRVARMGVAMSIARAVAGAVSAIRGTWKQCRIGAGCARSPYAALRSAAVAAPQEGIRELAETDPVACGRAGARPRCLHRWRDRSASRRVGASTARCIGARRMQGGAMPRRGPAASDGAGRLDG